MPDTKITALAAIGANPIIPSTFPLPMVDLTDTSMAASGTTKKVTVNQILGAGGTATLASATITGDLTVRTNKLKVDSSGVGVNTTSTTLGGGVMAIEHASNNGLVVNSTAGSPTIYLRNIADSNLAKLLFTDSGLNFDTANGGTFATINSTGNFVLKGGTAAANGVGVTFPATQVASSDANCLDDYEEGTWTGTLIGVTTNPTVPVTATGKYTKIGRQVTIVISFSNVSTVGASGVVGITGLPFTEDGERAVGTVALHTFDFDSGTSVYADVSGSTLFFSSQLTNAAWRDVKHNAGTGRYLRTTVTYNV